MTAADFAARLDAKRNGRGWQAHCPAHDDSCASLSIGEGDDGRVLLSCHAGCDTSAVLAALNLHARDLFSRPQPGSRKQLVCTYGYTDETGEILYQTVRYEPKDFRQRRPDGSGGWLWNLKGVRRVLYRLHDVRGRIADPEPEYRREHSLPDVFVVEGEKDADHLMMRGCIATSNVGGAGKWRQEYAQQLVEAGATSIVVIADNDRPGRQHALNVAKSCSEAGLAVKLVDLPGLPEKGDVSDWLRQEAAGNTIQSLIQLAAAAFPYLASPDNSDTLAPGASIDLADTLNGIESFICQYVVLSSEQSKLVTLWIAQTHAMAAFDYVAYLNIKSPMAECGKTRLLEVLETLVQNPWLTGRVTAAVLMRKVDAESPVLLLDESDAAFNGEKEYAEALRGLLNSGFHRSGKASACVGQGGNLTYKDFSTFGPKAIAGIGRLPSTVESRSIPIALKRRTKDEPLAKWRCRAAWEAAGPLRGRLAAAVGQHLDTLQQARPAQPEGLSDRAEDVLEGLFAIADAAGHDWPAAARQAAVSLVGYAARVAQEAEHHVGLELLMDIKGIFQDKGNPTVLKTQTIIEALAAMEERPWPTFVRGEKPITAHRLAKILKGFTVEKPAKTRQGQETFRGYSFDAFAEAFARYLPSEVEQVEQPNKYGPQSAKTEVERPSAVPHAKDAVSVGKHCVVPLVPLETPDEGDASDPEDANGYNV